MGAWEGLRLKVEGFCRFEKSRPILIASSQFFSGRIDRRGKSVNCFSIR